MKHFTLLLLFCGMLGHAKAQYGNDAHFETSQPVTTASDAWTERFAKNKIKTQTVYYDKYKNGKLVDSQKISYNSHCDKNGYFISGESYRNGKLIYTTYYEYNDDGYETRYKSLKKGKLRIATEYVYNEENQVVKRLHYWKDTVKSSWHMKYKYDDNGNLLEMNSYHKGKPDILWVYDYYPNNSKKSVAKYNGKGKLKNITSYECKQEGVLLALASKDTSRICIRHEFDENGEEVKIVEERAPRGKEEKVIYKYNSKNALLERAAYNNKGKRISLYKRKFKGDQIAEHINFKKGTDEIQSRYIYTYGDDDFIQRTERYGKNNELRYIYTYKREKF